MNAYNPSKAEVQWYAEANICKLANAPFQIRSMRQYLRGNAEFMSHIHNRTIETLTRIGGREDLRDKVVSSPFLFYHM